jgi:hypothetical protein
VKYVKSRGMEEVGETVHGRNDINTEARKVVDG